MPWCRNELTGPLPEQEVQCSGSVACQLNLSPEDSSNLLCPFRVRESLAISRRERAFDPEHKLSSKGTRGRLNEGNSIAGLGLINWSTVQWVFNWTSLHGSVTLMSSSTQEGGKGCRSMRISWS